MNYHQLGNTGLKLSTVGYGASPLGGVFEDINEQKGIETVHTAIDLGINYIDVSPYYGLTKAETVLGKALKSVPRDKYIISTKAGRYGSEFEKFDMTAKRIRQSLEESLSRLQIDEVDILFLHDIEFVDPNIVQEQAIPCLQALKKEGKVKHIGVTGYPMKIFRDVVAYTDIDCILSYCRFALHDDSLSNLIPELTAKGVGILNASPTGMGMLTERGAPEWHPASTELLHACQQAITLCKKANVNLTQLAMQYAVSHKNISSTLVGTANPQNIIDNVNWITQAIDENLVAEVQALFAPVKSRIWQTGLAINND